jgi:acyl-CoA synthetase (AMP-forming)/AMP-acid ligase II
MTSTIIGNVHRSALPAPPIEPSVAVAALRHAAADPDAPAVVDGATGETLTRGELAARSAAVAAGLRACGIGRGDLVAISMPNSAWWPVVALGAWRAGAAIEPLSPLWTASESARVLAQALPRAAIAFAPFAPQVIGALGEIRLDAEVFVAGGEVAGATPISALPAAAGDPFAEPDLAPGDLAAVPFSSGTGGLPKGIRLTHGNLAAAGAQANATLGTAAPVDEDAVFLAGAPFFHSIGLGLQLCGGLMGGATLVTVALPRLEAILELAAAHRATHLAVSPPIFEALAHDPRVDEHDLSSLRLVVTGGAHLAPGMEERVGERLGCLARQGYGMTEATCTISAPLLRPSTPGTVGWLAPGTEARLVDPETGDDAPEGEPGELWVRGPQVMEGYHGLPDETAAILTLDGWLRTGDLVSVRDDGQLVIRDRLKELIKVKGASVAPAEVELVLREHPAVRDACVVGAPDPERGEAPIAFVALSAPIEPSELLAFAADRLAGYKRPREIVIVDELPRLPTGKLVRRALRERAAAPLRPGAPTPPARPAARR